MEVIGNAILEFVTKYWLQWISTIFVAIGLFCVYLGVGGAEALPLDVTGRICLAIILTGIFIIYIIFCAVHENFEKKMASSGLDKKTEQEHKKKLSVRFLVTSVIFVVVSLVSIVLFHVLLGGKDGEYVIYSEQYRVALSPEIHNSYYLDGEKVSVRGDKLYDYPKECVFSIDFNRDGTFTVSHDGKLLGMTPGHNGIGYSDTCTSTLWKAIDAGDGAYRIVNVNEGAYLKWYDSANNWTTHEKIIEKYADQYIVCLEKVG